MADRIGYNGADKWKIKATELLNQGGGGGTDDYEDLENKPSINGVELSGNKTAAELGINIPTKTSDLTNDSGFITKSVDDLENYYKKTAYVDISEYPYGGTGYYSGVITIDEDYQTGNNREYMALWPDGIRLNFVYQDPDNPMVQRIVRNQLVSNFELWSLHGISKNIQDQIDALPTSDTTYTFSVGDSNGEIKVTPSSGSAYNVSVKGLGSAAYADTSDFQAPISGGATTIVSSNLTASRALVSDSSGKVAVSAVTSTELGYLSGVTSAIQTQLNGKAASSHTHNYAGSSSAGGAATSANKINTDAGSATNPVYFSNGIPVKTTYTLGKSVPSNAVFTDNNTTYTIATGDSNGQIKVTPSTGSAYNVGVKGLGSAAYLTADTAATANTVAKRQGNGYLNAVYFNMTNNSRQDPASYTAYPAFISSDGYLRQSTLANYKNFIGVGASKTATGTFSRFSASSSISFTSGSYFKIGNVMYVTVSVNFTAAVSTGSNATATIASFPSGGLGDVRSVAWNGGQGLLAGLTTGGVLTIRVVAQNVPVNATATFQFVMPCSN